MTNWHLGCHVIRGYEEASQVLSGYVKIHDSVVYIPMKMSCRLSGTGLELKEQVWTGEGTWEDIAVYMALKTVYMR